MKMIGLLISMLCASTWVHANPRTGDINSTLETEHKWYGIYLGMHKRKLDTEITSFHSESKDVEPNSISTTAGYITTTGVSSLSYAGIRTIQFYWSINHKLVAYHVAFEPTLYNEWITDLPQFFNGFDVSAQSDENGIETRLVTRNMSILTSNRTSGMLVTR
ncbi:hypothetical protein [Vibrio alfacsensis]|uniref:hypothetical protein n=2 Tax=Vibrio TaxID=662 RepID=UPI001BEDC90C|nr:hypothetical protein [Vibrio alfacsensis]BBM67637.1 hypothetical protein VA249_42830 [Vibrio alfacsensis]BCN27119.1 hypothetical protein VYA_43110 [Vibrio alfacsensis]